ncbi:hypothetical protein [Salipaludibacillus daqingensis]|uniref:hypothetical protein n=1 Tax=Salipaludibacillus daqingensis TaxID=3041001 RepID=UPI0024750DE0|nr:hypothetical protein [Salipaludibacillus daqingensis]
MLVYFIVGFLIVFGLGLLGYSKLDSRHEETQKLIKQSNEEIKEVMERNQEIIKELKK